jgi:signal peptidase
MNSISSSTLRSAAARAGGLLVNTVLVVVVLTGAVFLLPGLFGYERYVITGGSMSGTFERGSVAFEESVPVSDLRVGDVITYLPPADSGLTALVTHRIVEKKSAPESAIVFRTRGDANAVVDPWTFQLSAASQPRVAFTIPMIGYAFLALADPQARMLVIGVPAGVVACYSLGELIVALRARLHLRLRPAAA